MASLTGSRGGTYVQYSGGNLALESITWQVFLAEFKTRKLNTGLNISIWKICFGKYLNLKTKTC